MELGLDRSSCSIVAQAEESVGGFDVLQNQQLLETLSTKIRWFDLEIYGDNFCEHLRKISTFPGFQIQPFWSDESLRKSPHQPHSANGQPLNSHLLGKIQ